MGIEYRIKFKAPDTESVVTVFRRIPWARQSSNASLEFEMHENQETSHWSDATVVIEPGGVYFRDNGGGSGRHVLGEVVAQLLSVFGQLTIEGL